MKRILGSKKVFGSVFLIMAFFVFSAFKDAESQNITRYDFAVLVEDLLTTEGFGEKNEEVELFKDLREEKCRQICRTIAFEVMSGFPGKMFCPDEELRNIETVSYLQKLSRLFFEHKPKSYASKQLMRLFAYQIEKDNLGSLPGGIFPKKLLDSGSITDRKTIEDVFYSLKQGDSSKEAAIEGLILNAATDEPIAGAFVVCFDSAVKANEKGVFIIDLSHDFEDIEIFAAHDDYEPLEIKKNITFDKYVELRLKPRAIK